MNNKLFIAKNENDDNVLITYCDCTWYDYVENCQDYFSTIDEIMDSVKQFENELFDTENWNKLNSICNFESYKNVVQLSPLSDCKNMNNKLFIAKNENDDNVLIKNNNDVWFDFVETDVDCFSNIDEIMEMAEGDGYFCEESWNKIKSINNFENYKNVVQISSKLED